MTKIIIPNTSVVVDNPRAVDQSTVIDPKTGRTWQAAPVGYRPGDPISPQALALFNQGRGIQWATPDTPQPGSYDPTPAEANPVLFNVDPPVPNKGLPVVVTRNADGSTATAHGTIAGTTVTFNSPA
jgi:hypothetical protein